MPAISVIVPARDVVAYVGRVLDDLRHQHLDDLEVLVVDDASTDGTTAVLDRVADEDPRVRVLTGDGSGPSAARNLALDHADSDAIAFVDADDRVSHRYLDTMYASMTASGSDVVVANARRLLGGRTRASRLHLRVCATPAVATHLREAPELVYDTTVWNKLIRRELWEADGLRFEPGRWINDVYPSLRTHVLARQVDVLPDVLYHWRLRDDPLTSITSSKFHDAHARLKSLEDRLFAIESSRAMLARDLPDAAVLRRFDERVLVHDLWTYLPMFSTADHAYRRTLTAGVAAFLEADAVDLDRHPLGPLLDALYRAMRAGDQRQVADLLAPHTEVVARAAEGQVTTWVEPSPRRGPRIGIARRQPVGGPTTGLTAEVRIERAGFTSGATLAIDGRVRLRDGQSDVAGPWQVRGELVDTVSDARIASPAVPLAPVGDRHLHPLQRSGWRAFTATIALDDLARHPGVSWRLQVGLELDGIGTPGEVLIAAQVPATLVTGVALDATTDVFADLDPTGRLRLRTRWAPARLTTVGTDPDGTRLDLGLRVGIDDGRPIQVWLAGPDDDADDPPADAVEVDLDGRVSLPLPPIDVAPGTYWPLWISTGDAPPRRLRSVAALTTTRLTVATDTEVVVRATAKGAAVLAVRHPRVALTEVAVGDDASLLRFSGPPLHPALVHADRLHLASVWNVDTLSVPLTAGPHGWFADLPLPRLADGSSSPATANEWRITVAKADGTLGDVRVDMEVRARFPIEVTTPVAVAELRLAGSGRLRLFVGRPEPDR